MTVSAFTTHTSKDTQGTSSVLVYLEGVKNGQWQDQVLAARKAYNDKPVYKALKVKLGGIFPHGQFGNATNDSFIAHSGFVCLDIDHLDEPPADYSGEISYQEHVEALIKSDPYTYALHRSLSGFGICVWVRPKKISKETHNWAYKQILLHYGETYGLIMDESAGTLAKRRAWSYDPYLYHNPNAQYYKVTAEPKQVIKEIKVAFSDSDIDNLVRDIRQRSINLVPTYEQWRDVGFALASGLGEAGRDYFHIISQIDDKYKQSICDRQYTFCIRGSNSNKITIGTFFYRCKEHGLTIVSERTQRITTVVMQGRKNGNTKAAITQDVTKVLQEEPTESDTKLIADAMQLPDNSGSGLDLDEQLRIYLTNNYTIKYNLVLQQVEVDGVPIDDIKFNSIWLAVRKVISDKINREVLKAMLNSDTFTVYHPIQDYLKELPIVPTKAEYLHIAGITEPTPIMPLTWQLAQSLGSTNEDTISWCYYFLLRWGVGMMYQGMATTNMPNSLCPILSGPINSGKTSWIRQLLPVALSPFVTQLEAGAKELDRSLQFCTSLLCYDDEGLGHTQKSNQQFKAEMSKTKVTGRAAYAQFAATRPRLASMAMTTNEDQFLNDASGNRRAIPIHVQQVNWAIYNAIDKRLLLAEWYSLYSERWDFQLSNEAIQYLNEVDAAYTVATDEDNLIDLFLLKAKHNSKDSLVVNPTILLKVLLMGDTHIRLSSTKLGLKLKAKGFVRHGRNWVVRFKNQTMYDQYLVLIGEGNKEEATGRTNKIPF